MTEVLGSTIQIWDAEEYHNLSYAQNEASAELLRHIQFIGTESVLDLGCGNGEITSKIANLLPAGSILGIDISPEMIQFAESQFPKFLYPNITFKIQDAQNIDFFNDYDIVFSSFALQWIKDKNGLFQKIYNSLTNNGLLAVTTPLQVSPEFDKAIHILLSKDKWANYFTSFSPPWHFTNSNIICSLITENSFSISYLKICIQKVLFPSKIHLENYIKLWFPFFTPLPENLRDDFFGEFMEEYLKLIPALETGEVMMNIPRLDLLASKSLS